jgi:hypothetical protein
MSNFLCSSRRFDIICSHDRDAGNTWGNYGQMFCMKKAAVLGELCDPWALCFSVLIYYSTDSMVNECIVGLVVGTCVQNGRHTCIS